MMNSLSDRTVSQQETRAMLKRADKEASAKIKSGKMTFTQASFPLNELMPLAKLPIPKLIDVMRRQYGITVLVGKFGEVIPGTRPVSLLKLTEPGMEKETEALIRYTQERKQGAPEKGGDVHLAPYSYKDRSQVGHRPLFGRPVVLLSQFASRGRILHELTHAILDKSAHPVIPTINGHKIHPKSIEHFATQAIAVKYDAAIKNGKTLSGDDTVKFYRGFFRGILHLGEEVDICRTFLDNRSSLGLSLTEQGENIGYILELREQIDRRLDLLSTGRGLAQNLTRSQLAAITGEQATLERKLADFQNWQDKNAPYFGRVSQALRKGYYIK